MAIETGIQDWALSSPTSMRPPPGLPAPPAPALHGPVEEGTATCQPADLHGSEWTSLEGGGASGCTGPTATAVPTFWPVAEPSPALMPPSLSQFPLLAPLSLNTLPMLQGPPMHRTAAASGQAPRSPIEPMPLAAPWQLGTESWSQCFTMGGLDPIWRTAMGAAGADGKGDVQGWLSSVPLKSTAQAEAALSGGPSPAEGLPQELDSELSPAHVMPSRGSAVHGTGRCQPCAWFWRPEGCHNGQECGRCHLCPPGEVKARKKAKRMALRLGALEPAKNGADIRAPRALRILPLLL